MAYLQDPSKVVHGTHAGYRRGCKCAPCKAANTEVHQAMYYRNLERERARNREYHQAKVEVPARHAAFKARMRADKLRQRYGLTVEDWDAMIVAQSGLCATCDKQLAGNNTPTSPCVDHDHTTGQVRAILCRNCNSAIGLLEDSPDRAMALAAYLLSFTDVLTPTPAMEMT